MGREESSGETGIWKRQGLGEEGLHAEDRRTGRGDWCSMRRREESGGGAVKHKRHSVYLRTSDKEESLSSDLGRAEN